MRTLVLSSLGISLLALAGCQAHEPSSSTQTAATASKAPDTGTVAAVPVPPTLRLPDTVRPVGYEAALTVVPTEARFDGRITLTVELRAPARIVWLNAHQLDVRSASVNGQKATVVPGGSDFLGIATNEPLPAGRASIVIDYSGEISDTGQEGLFRQKDGSRWYGFTQFEAISARHVFPCFDEPSFKVPWKLRLKVKKGDLAVSNTPVVSETAEGEFNVVQFAETKPLPSYLIAFGVGPFDVVDAGVAGKNRTAVRILVPRGRSAEARYAKEMTGPILNQLEDYFGIPYAYEKLDILDVPIFGGAMENPGLVTFDESALLSAPEKETPDKRRRFTSIMTHELAHQWFGNLVTTSWWDDIWLNESFATWMTNRILEKWKPEWHWDAERASDASKVKFTDGLVHTRRIREPIASKHDIVNAFDDITYEKGQAVIDMFENAMGQQTFRAGVQRYLAKYAHKNGTADQFLSAVFGGEHAPLKAAFESFLNQPGVPLVSVQLRCDAGAPPKLALAQERYLPAGSGGKRDVNWQVPVCARYPGKNGLAVSCTTLTEARGELPLVEAAACPSWVNANAGAHGYYRTHHQGELLSKLRANLKELSRAERVSLVSDLGALVQTDKLSYADALDLVPKFASDADPTVLHRLVDVVRKLRVSDLVSEATRSKYARFVRDTFGTRAKKFGMEPRPGEDEDTRLSRTALLSLVADEGEDPLLRKQAKAMAVRWLKDRKGIQPEVLGTVLGIAAISGDRALLDGMLAAARTTQDRFEREQLFDALGAFRDPALLGDALKSTLSADFDPREAMEIFKATQKTAATRAMAFDFVKQNYDGLMARFPQDGLFSYGAYLPSMVGGSFCDEGRATEVEGFFRDRTIKYSGGPRELAKSIESIRVCSAFRSMQEPNVSAFFQKK